MFEHVVVPLDGTPLAERALGLAVSLGRGGSHLHLVTVVRPPLAEFSELTPGLATASGDIEEGYLEGVEQRVREAGVAEVTTARLRGERVVDTLEGYRTEVGAGLTVMCTHGRGAVKRAWLGSVADGLIRTSEAPVLLVRAGEEEDSGDAELGADLRLKRLLVALDGSHFSRQALGAARKLAGSLEPQYLLARVIEAPSGLAFRAFTQVTDERLQKARTLAEAKLKLEVQSFASNGDDVEAVTEFAPSVAQGILDLAGKREADVIVIATHGRTGVPRLVLGSVADKVVRGADRPVLVVRPSAS